MEAAWSDPPTLLPAGLTEDTGTFKIARVPNRLKRLKRFRLV